MNDTKYKRRRSRQQPSACSMYDHFTLAAFCPVLAKRSRFPVIAACMLRRPGFRKYTYCRLYDNSRGGRCNGV